MLYRYRQFHCSCKTEDIYEGIAKERPLPKGKNKKVITWNNNERICEIKSKIIDLTDGNNKSKQVKGTKNL